MKTSAGLLVYRFKDGQVEVLIAHPGGPYFTKKDAGVWSIPKGEVDKDEEPVEAAKREFEEELGLPAPNGDLQDLGEAKYPKGSKLITAWAVQADVDISAVDNTKIAKISIEWPPHSGKKQEFPEVDRAGWFYLETAANKLFDPQVVFLKRLADILQIAFRPPNNEPKQLDLL
jgi:predicted NUDIX family NTP pyrophosphohydrolase